MKVFKALQLIIFNIYCLHSVSAMEQRALIVKEQSPNENNAYPPGQSPFELFLNANTNSDVRGIILKKIFDESGFSAPGPFALACASKTTNHSFNKLLDKFPQYKSFKNLLKKKLVFRPDENSEGIAIPFVDALQNDGTFDLSRFNNNDVREWNLITINPHTFFSTNGLDKNIWLITTKEALIEERKKTGVDDPYDGIQKVIEDSEINQRYDKKGRLLDKIFVLFRWGTHSTLLHRYKYVALDGAPDDSLHSKGPSLYNYFLCDTATWLCVVAQACSPDLHSRRTYILNNI